MNADLVRLWNEVVTDRHDEVLFLGDFAFYKKDPEGCQALFRNLNGRKTLIWGSHDQYMEKLPWERIVQHAPGRPALDIVDGVWLTHEGELIRPLAASSDTILCGHVHQIWQMRGNMLNIGVDVWWGRPVPWEKALSYWRDRWDYFQRTGRDA